MMLLDSEEVRPGDRISYRSTPYEERRYGMVLAVKELDPRWCSPAFDVPPYPVRNRRLLVRWDGHLYRPSWVNGGNCELGGRRAIKLKAHHYAAMAREVAREAWDEDPCARSIDIPMMRADDDTRPLRACDV